MLFFSLDIVLRLRELHAQNQSWFADYANTDAILAGLQSSGLYREFRTGDVKLEPWQRQETTGDRLRLALDFLFY